MNVLHINQNFPFQTAHPGLVRAVDDASGWTQSVYVPVPPVMAKTRFDAAAEPYEVIISTDYGQRDRYFQARKSKKIHQSMERQLTGRDFDLVHAHTLVAAGNVALRWQRSHGTPYVVSVRNTDLTTFLARPRLFAKMAAEVADNAAAIIALNPSHAAQLEERLGPFTKDSIGKKIHVVPNGIDDFWLQSSATTSTREAESHRVLYVGELTANKNLGRLIAALQAVGGRSDPIELRIVGDGPERKTVVELCDTAGFKTEMIGWTKDRETLREHYRWAHLFAMPSLAETFGLVYIEALSQGVPIIYSRGQGVHGFFGEREVGLAVDAASTENIRRGIGALISDRDAIAARCVPAAQRFAWPTVAAEIVEIYSEATA